MEHKDTNIEIYMELKEGNLEAEFRVPEISTLSMLQNHLGELKQSLIQEGIDVGHVDVVLSSFEDSSAGFQNQHQNPQYSQQQRHNTNQANFAEFPQEKTVTHYQAGTEKISYIV